MPRIYLYAEVLTHIRQLTLYASVQTQKKEGTKLDIHTDKKVVSVTHEDETQRLYLPTQISGTAQITFPLAKTTDVSARVQIEDEHEWKLSINNEIQAPWMASDLRSSTAIQCRYCDSTILASDKVRSWKDLPSENWAELMEFWFCHKPHEGGHGSEDAAEARGFSSKSKLAIVPGTGMTDLISIVLHAEDCENIKAAETQKRPDLTMIRCTRCAEILGTTNEDEELVRLHKSSIAVSTPEAKVNFETYPSTIFTCAQILSLIEATALKKFVIHSFQANHDASRNDPNERPLILWVFNADIYYSCSAYERNGLLTSFGAAADVDQHDEDLAANDISTAAENSPTAGQQPKTEHHHGHDDGDDTSPSNEHSSGPATSPPSNEHINLVHRAAKIFYQALPANTLATTFLDANSTSHEELYLSNVADLVALRQTLERSTASLPDSVREFQEWKVGLLDRYEKVPSGLGVMQENPLARGIKAKDGRVTRWDIGHGAEGLYA